MYDTTGVTRKQRILVISCEEKRPLTNLLQKHHLLVAQQEQVAALTLEHSVVQWLMHKQQLTTDLRKLWCKCSCSCCDTIVADIYTSVANIGQTYLSPAPCYNSTHTIRLPLIRD